MQSILRPSDGGMLIMIAFILMGAVGSMHFLGGGTSSSLLYAQSDKMLMRVTLFERSIRNGVAHVMETGKCLDGTELQNFPLLDGFRNRLISVDDSEREDNGGDLDVEGNSFRTIAKCLLGTDLPRDIQFNSFKLDRLSKPYAAVQFSVTVDIAVKTQGGAGGRSLSYRTAVTDQKLFFSALAEHHVGYVFKTQGGEKSDGDLIQHQESDSVHIEFHAPVFIYNTAENGSGISNLLQAVGSRVFFNDVVRSNFNQINYFASASGHHSLGQAKSVFKHGVSTRRWTTLNDAKLDNFRNSLGQGTEGTEVITVASFICSSPKIYKNNPEIEVVFSNDQGKFCGFIHAATLKITIGGDGADERMMYFEGGFVVDKLEIDGGENSTIVFGESNAGSVEDLYKVSM